MPVTEALNSPAHAQELTEQTHLLRLIDVKPASRMYSVSWRTFLRWADAGRVPWGVKISGRRLWRLDELEAHIRDGCRPVKKGGAK
jgi:hypothetical protein